jgi:hypothetical protein
VREREMSRRVRRLSMVFLPFFVLKPFQLPDIPQEDVLLGYLNIYICNKYRY